MEIAIPQSIMKKMNDIFFSPDKDRKSILKFSSFVILFLIVTVSVHSQQQITENLKCTYVANSFGSNLKWVQNFIENISVTKDGTVYTNSYWDEAHRPFGVYTKCNVIGNSNRNPNSLVATDCDGKTWTIKNPYMRFMHSKIAPVPTGDLAPYILCSDGREIRSFVDPTAIAIDNQCRLMVADNGPDQNITVLDISGTGAPVFVKTIGDKGGALSGPKPGIIEPLKFWGIRGIGTDSVGNLWVANSGFPSQVGGGTDLRHFDTNLNMDCQMLGLAFVQSMDADPLNPTHIYSSGERYEMDYNVPAGDLQAHWKYAAQTLDPFRYPDDPRLDNSLESTFIRYIDGKKFMFLTNMYSEFLVVYRFDGEIAVPCAFFSVAWDGQWDKYKWQIDKRPKFNNAEGNRWMWRDNNGDGQVQKEEFTTYNLGYPHIKGIDIDKNGNVYLGSRLLCYFAANGLDGNGVPNYSAANMVRTNSPFTYAGGDMSRIKYVDETDVMYFGTGAGFPMFSDIIRYKNWSKGERIADTLKIGDNLVTFTADEKYIYVNRLMQGIYTGKMAEIDIWDAETLEPVGYILPGAEVNYFSGMLDLMYGLQVSKLPSGERLLIAEEDYNGKNILYRWCPDGDCITPDFSIELTSPLPGIGYMNASTLTFEASVNAGSTPISKVEFYADNVKIGEDTSSPYSLSVNNLSIGTHMVYAKAIGQNNASAKSNYFGLNITDGTPQVFLQSPMQNYDYNMFEDIVLAATAQDFDGTIQKIEFFANNSLVGESTSSSIRIEWGNLSAGQYRIYAKATDNDGKTAVTPTITINVSDKYEKSFLSPAKGLMISDGSNFDIQLDTEGVNNIKSISYYNGNTLLNSTSDAPYLYSVNNTTSGIYKLSAVITLNNDKQLKAQGPSVFVLPTVFDCEHTGMMNIDFWDNVSGTNIASIPTANLPTESGMVDIFEGPINRADNYGARISGYICPPQTGEYTFWTSGDDNNQISIKLPDADTLRVIAYVNEWTGSRSWSQFASQQSQPITLQAGQMYVVEGLLKEGSGGDNFAVGWRLPDGTLERPIPGNRITPLYNPLTLNDDVSIKIISPADGATLNRNDSITIVAEVEKGISDISLMKFYTSALTMAGTDKTPESNIFSFKTKLASGTYKLTARGLYKHLLTIPSNTVSITVKNITGLEDAFTDDFEIYPNPLSTGSLSIKLPSDATQLSILDVTGKLVYKEKVMKTEYTIDQSVFKSKGVYVVNVVTTKNSWNKKVIVTK
jgi:hypothetical protein